MIIQIFMAGALEKYANSENYNGNSFLYLLKPLILSALVLSLHSYSIQAQNKKPKKTSFVETLVIQYFGKQPNNEQYTEEAETKTNLLKKDNLFFSARVRMAYIFGGSKGVRRTIDRAVSCYKLKGEEKRYVLKRKKEIRKQG